MIAGAVFYYFGVIGRFYLLLVQMKWITDLENVWFLVAGFLRFESFGICLGCVAVIALERCFATYFIMDYEARNRPWVIAICFIFSFMYTQFFVIPVCFLNFRLIYVACWSLSWTVIGNMILLFLYKYNSKELRRLNWRYDVLAQTRSVQYTLGKKYQIEENIKITKCLMVMGLMLISVISLSLSIMYLPSSSIYKNTSSQHISASFDFCLALASNVVPSICLFFLNADQRLFNKNKKVVPKNMNIESETKQYFDQLQKSWQSF